MNRHREEWKKFCNLIDQAVLGDLEEMPEDDDRRSRLKVPFFQMVEWSAEMDKTHLEIAEPGIVLNLCTRPMISILAAFRKLYDFGGIVVRNEEGQPCKGTYLLAAEWVRYGAPRKLSAGHRVTHRFGDRTIVLAADSANTDCKLVYDKLLTAVKENRWIHPTLDEVDISVLL